MPRQFASSSMLARVSRQTSALFVAARTASTSSTLLSPVAAAAARCTSSSSSTLLKAAPTTTSSPSSSSRVASMIAASAPTAAFSRPSPILSALSSRRPTLLASPIASASHSPLLFAQAGEAVRCVTYGAEYQPSQRKRKRKHGFLARLKKHKTVLKARRKQGRRFLSH